MDEPWILRDQQGAVLTLTMNRAAQFNPLSSAMLSALQLELDRVREDVSVRVVVLAGGPKAFSAGHDLREMRANPDAEYYQKLFNQCTRMMMSLQRLPQPVIAKVQGMATAAGCQLVAMCDLAVAASDSRFAVSGVNLGLFCSTPSVALSRNVSRKAAFEMLFTGDFINAQQALEKGLVNRVVEADQLDAEVQRLAEQICAKSAQAITLGKQLFYKQLEMGIEAAYQLAGHTMACNMMGADAQEGFAAFIEKRAPRKA